MVILRLVLLGLLALVVFEPFHVDAQSAPCGLVDAIEYPIDVNDTLVQGYDDFALFRARFGGLHTGIDIGFNRRGEPVRAAARGRVTYSDINGWDTEKGVVIVEHTFPDGSLAYSVYGHMEQSNTILFPTVGACVERGDILGTIGWPSRGLPHLHYELRDFLPTDGGPGYVDTNPLLQGWYHPFDFTLLWQARLNPAVTGYARFFDYPTLPPVLLDTGGLIIASGDTIIGYAPPSTAIWQIQMEGVVTGLAGLPGGRTIAHSRGGQTIQILDGRIVAAWDIDSARTPFVVLNETLIFLTAEGDLNAFTPAGTPLWSQDLTAERIIQFEAGHSAFVLAQRANGVTRWRLMDAAGTTFSSGETERTPTFASTPFTWYVLDGMNVGRVDGPAASTLASTGALAGRSSTFTADVLGNLYIYLDDGDHSLLAISPSGEIRWRVRYPAGRAAQAPLLDIGGGCLLYTLDTDGMLNVFSTADGSRLTQLQIYAGGVQNGSPRARLLVADEQERILLGGGFLSMIALNGSLLGGDAIAGCLLG